MRAASISKRNATLPMSDGWRVTPYQPRQVPRPRKIRTSAARRASKLRMARSSRDDRLPAGNVVPDDVAIEFAAGGEEDPATGGLRHLICELYVLGGLIPCRK